MAKTKLPRTTTFENKTLGRICDNPSCDQMIKIGDSVVKKFGAKFLWFKMPDKYFHTVCPKR